MKTAWLWPSKQFCRLSPEELVRQRCPRNSRIGNQQVLKRSYVHIYSKKPSQRSTVSANCEGYFSRMSSRFSQPPAKILRPVLKQIRGHGHGAQFPVVVPDRHLIRRGGGTQGCQERIIMFGGWDGPGGSGQPGKIYRRLEVTGQDGVLDGLVKTVGPGITVFHIPAD